MLVSKSVQFRDVLKKAVIDEVLHGEKQKVKQKRNEEA